MKKIIIFFGIITMVFGFGWALLAFLQFSTGVGGLKDGLGRILMPSPFFIRMVFGTDRLWAGFHWFIIDLLIFWGCIGLGALILNKFWGSK